MQGIGKPKRIAELHFDTSMDLKGALGFFYENITTNSTHAALFMRLPLESSLQGYMLIWFREQEDTVFAEPQPGYLDGMGRGYVLAISTIALQLAVE